MREQFNTIIALLLILIGKDGKAELLKKRRANKKLIRYLERFELTNKDLVAIFNSTKSGVKNLRVRKK